MLYRAISIFLLAAIGVIGILLLVMFISLMSETNYRIARAEQGPLWMLSAVWIGLIASIIAMSAAQQRRQALLVLNYIEQGVRLNLPLPKVIEAIGDSESGSFKQRMQECRFEMEQGASLETVLSSIPRIPRNILTMIGAAERAGNLPQALARIMEQHRKSAAAKLFRLSFYRVYPWMLIIVVISIVSMVMTFVMPKFETIFHDFHVALPPITISLLTVCREVGPLLALAVVLLCVIILFSQISSMWQGEQFEPGRDLLWRVTNHLPWIGTMRFQTALGDVLDFTADSVETGRPMDASLQEAANITTNSILRSRIDAWVSAIQSGQPIAAAASAAKMPALLSGMLATAVFTPDLAVVLRFLARYYRMRFSRAALLLQAATIPAVALGMGLVVGWVALSLFLPLIQLINAADPYSRGM